MGWWEGGDARGTRGHDVGLPGRSRQKRMASNLRSLSLILAASQTNR